MKLGTPHVATVWILAAALAPFGCASNGNGGGGGGGHAGGQAGGGGSTAIGGNVGGGAQAGAGGGSAGAGGTSSGGGGAAGGAGGGAGGQTAGGSDAGTPDGSVVDGRDLSTDRSKFFGDSRCAAAHVQLCEDFESGALDGKTWQANGQAPVVAGGQHARGTKALHVMLTGNGEAYIRETKTFPEPKNTYYGRVFVYFVSLPTDPAMTYAHWTFGAASGTGVMGEIRLSGQLQNKTNLFGVGTDSYQDANGTGDWTLSDRDPMNKPSAVPLNQWLCIEWMHDGEHNETRFWWDAVEHTSLHTTAAVHGGNKNPFNLPTFTNLWLGWQEYQDSTLPFELWMDEIAVDPQRIGCVI